MAKNETKPKKKKQGLVSRMMFGDYDKPDLTPEKARMSKWALFKHLFFSRFGTMVGLNLLTCIFAIPAAVVCVLFYMNITVSNGLIPYSSNLGIGYPVVIDAVKQGEIAEFIYNLYQYMLLVPCIAIFALGLSGNFYVMRKLIWEEPTSTFKDFFRGIGKCWLPALLIGFAFGLTVLLFKFSLGYFDAYGLPVGYKVVSVILSSIVLVFMSLFTSFFLTQNAAFKMRPTVLIRNSFLFVMATNVQAIFFVGIAVLPVFLIFIPNITTILVMLYVFVGFSFATLVISLYTHYCYERFLYDKIDRPSAQYTKRQTDIEEMREAAQAKKKQSATPYKNPKKRKKSIDEGASITGLTPTFKREDLQRLEEEHKLVMAESDELGELDDDEPSGTDSVPETVVPESEPPEPENAPESVAHKSTAPESTAPESNVSESGSRKSKSKKGKSNKSNAPESDSDKSSDTDPVPQGDEEYLL